MAKKKFRFILSILLLLLVLGSCGTCYATSFSENELRTIFYNSLTNFGTLENKDDVRTMLQATSFASWANYSNEYEYTFIACPILTADANISIYMFYDNVNDKKSMYNYIHYTRYVRASYNKNTKNISFATDYAPNAPTYLQQNGLTIDSWRFNDLNFYTNTTSDTITLDSGWHPNNIDNGEFVDKYWSFTPSNSDVVYVPSFEPYKFEPMTPISINSTNLGTLIGGIHCDEIRVVRVYYSNNDWVMSKGTTFYKFPQNGSLLNYTGGSSENDWTCPINMNLSNLANNIIAIQFNSKDSDYPSIRHWFFVENNNTIVNNDNIDASSTFSGDYYNSYNNQNNINNINDNNDLNTEEIVGAIGGLVSSDYSGDLTSGDIPSIDIEDPTEDFFTWFYRQFVNVLNNNNNVDLIIPIWKTDYRVPSDVFILDIEPLRSFISLGWWVIVGVPFLKFIRRSIEKLKGGNVPMSDEKSDLLGNVL